MSKEREAFENRFYGVYDFTPHENGQTTYQDIQTLISWRTWQAAATHYKPLLEKAREALDAVRSDMSSGGLQSGVLEKIDVALAAINAATGEK